MTRAEMEAKIKELEGKVAKAEGKKKENNVRGMSMSRKGNKVTIEFDITGDFGLSKEGKSTIVASSGGFLAIEGTDVIVSLNVCKKVAK